MKTREYLKKLAIDIYNEKVFTDRQLANVSDLQLVFMPLVFFDEQGFQAFKEKEPVLIFEYLDKAGPRGVNGYPTFMSFNFLVKEELDIVLDFITQYKEAMERIT